MQGTRFCCQALLVARLGLWRGEAVGKVGREKWEEWEGEWEEEGRVRVQMAS